MCMEVPEDLLLHGLEDAAVEEILRVECGIAEHGRVKFACNKIINQKRTSCEGYNIKK